MIATLVIVVLIVILGVYVYKNVDLKRDVQYKSDYISSLEQSRNSQIKKYQEGFSKNNLKIKDLETQLEVKKELIQSLTLDLNTVDAKLLNLQEYNKDLNYKLAEVTGTKQVKSNAQEEPVKKEEVIQPVKSKRTYRKRIKKD